MNKVESYVVCLAPEKCGVFKNINNAMDRKYHARILIVLTSGNTRKNINILRAGNNTEDRFLAVSD